MTPNHVQTGIATPSGWVRRFRYLRAHWYAQGAAFPRCGVHSDLERGPWLAGRSGVSFGSGLAPESACRQCVLGIVSDVVKAALAEQPGGRHA